MVNQWLNVRSMLTEEQLHQIYKYEEMEEYLKYHPAQVVEHGVSKERWIDIPQPILQSY
ncbi:MULTISPECIES: hypothetical protein [unclassified Paenibacillus]|uniref:hypothetical protein n=1 Tax=unclassified Paenibacillus TaxID=185978 RepID=UPI0030F8F589